MASILWSRSYWNECDSRRGGAAEHEMSHEMVTEITSPLIRRKQGAGLVVVTYPGQVAPARLVDQVFERFREDKNRVVSVPFLDLAPNPVEMLVERSDSSDVFSIHIEPETLSIGNTEGAKLVDALNLHRDKFRDHRLQAILWVPQLGMEVFLDHASNFFDYRLRLVDLDTEWTEPTETEALPAICHNIPHPPPGRGFVGRDNELAALAESLETERLTTICQPIGIQGLGGIGKTQLAVEYAWRHAREFSHLLFVTADTPEILRRNLAHLGTEPILGLFSLGEERGRCGGERVSMAGTRIGLVADPGQCRW